MRKLITNNAISVQTRLTPSENLGRSNIPAWKILVVFETNRNFGDWLTEFALEDIEDLTSEPTLGDISEDQLVASTFVLAPPQEWDVSEYEWDKE